MDIREALLELVNSESVRYSYMAIEKIIIVDKLVDNWTYPLIQPCLLQEATNRGFL